MGKNVAVTWGTWFVGSFLVEQLVHEWHKVHILKRSSSKKDNISHMIDNDLVQICNIDSWDMDGLFAENDFDAIMHLATSYWRKWEKPSEIFESAIMLPMKLLELAKEYKVKAFINTDSYFNKSITLKDNIWFHAEAKRDFLKYAKQAIKGSDIKFANVVMWHVYWPRDHEKKLVPGVIQQLLREQKKIPMVKGDNQRNFVYVKDLVRVYTTILNNLETLHNKVQYRDYYDRTWEITTVKEMVEMLKAITWSSSSFDWWAYPEREQEIMKITPNLDSTIHKTWWKPEYTLEEWLQETIEYYKSLLYK